MRTSASALAKEAPAKQEAGRSSARAATAPQPVFAPPVIVQRKCACGGECPSCKEEQRLESDKSIQTKLAVRTPGNPHEQEADRMAEQVMRMPEESPSLTPAPPTLQRKCAACEGEGEKSQAQRKPTEAMNTNGTVEAPAIVHEVLRSPGQALDPITSASMEAHFGHDFSQVRVHADEHAAVAASAVQALAFTVGTEVVFGQGQYAPGTAEGTRLLAHELAHVAQQVNAPSFGTVERISAPGDAAECAADAAAERIVQDSTPTVVGPTLPATTLFRRVGSVNCPPNVFGAPADPRAELEAVDPVAVALATQAADGLAADAIDVRTGIRASPSVTFQSYQDHFGLPNAVGSGFLNRLTGIVRPSLEVAASEELGILSRRFRFAARLFSETVNYRCPGNATITLPGCGRPDSCGTAFAFSCGGFTIALCEPFWSALTSDEARAAAEIHESMHIMLGPTTPSEPGQIGETVQRGPGRNFNVAGCYEFIIDDIAGVDSQPVCPPVP